MDDGDLRGASKSNTNQMNYEILAGKMYEAYCQAVGGKAFNGDPLPDWQTFRADASKQKQSDAWIAAAQAGSQVIHDHFTGGPPILVIR